MLAITEIAQKLQQEAVAQTTLEQALTATLEIESNPVPENIIQFVSIPDKSRALVAIAETVEKFEDPQIVQKILRKILAATNTIEAPPDRTDVLIAIAKVARNIQEASMAKTVLDKALMAAIDIQENAYKTGALIAIAKAAGNGRNEPLAQAALDKALTAVAALEDSNLLVVTKSPYYVPVEGNPKSFTSIPGKSSALDAIAEVIGNLHLNQVDVTIWQDLLKAAEEADAWSVLAKMAVQQARMGNWRQALQALRHCEERTKITTLTKIQSLWAERNNLALLDEATIAAIRPIEQSGDYVFEVTIRSLDQDCNDYTNWWEVRSTSGELLSQTLLEQPHPDREPFRSTSKPFKLEPERMVIIRAHRETRPSTIPYTKNYLDQAQLGSLATGFQSIRLSEQFAEELAEADPQPICRD